MENSLDVGADALQEELSGTGILLRPVVKKIYNTIVRGELRTSTKRIIGGIMKMCKRMIADDVEVDSEEFYGRLEKKFPDYLKVEATGQQCKASHKNFPKLKRNLKRTFEYQLKPVLHLLQVEKQVDEYGELCKEAFDREELKYLLKSQTDSMKYGIDIIEQDKSILKLPAGKNLFLKVLRKGFNRKVEDFQKEIDKFYS